MNVGKLADGEKSSERIVAKTPVPAISREISCPRTIGCLAKNVSSAPEAPDDGREDEEGGEVVDGDIAEEWRGEEEKKEEDADEGNTKDDEDDAEEVDEEHEGADMDAP